MLLQTAANLSVFDYLGVPFQYCLEGLTAAFKAVPPLATVGAFGLAVIATTLIIRGALFPIFGWQLRTSRRIQAEQRLIGPQLQALRKKFRGDRIKLQEEIQKLYAEHNMSPFSSLTGCLPALVQAPVLVGLYRGIGAATEHVARPERGFLWIGDVAQSGAAACCEVLRNGKVVSTDWGGLLTHPVVLILPLLAGLLTFVQSRMMMPPLRPEMSDQERTMANVTKQMSFIFPLVIIWLSLNFAQGLALYWATGTFFMVLQQYHLVGWGGLHVPAWFPGAGRTTALSYPRHAGPAAPAAPVVQAALAGGPGRARPSRRGGEGASATPRGAPSRSADRETTALLSPGAASASAAARRRRNKKRR